MATNEKGEPTRGTTAEDFFVFARLAFEATHREYPHERWTYDRFCEEYSDELNHARRCASPGHTVKEFLEAYVY